jgi:hypothetical protein
MAPDVLGAACVNAAAPPFDALPDWRSQLTQFDGPSGPVYIVPNAIQAVGAPDSGLLGIPQTVRCVYIASSWLLVLDTPENRRKAGIE